jgi:hypothetical protein
VLFNYLGRQSTVSQILNDNDYIKTSQITKFKILMSYPVACIEPRIYGNDYIKQIQRFIITRTTTPGVPLQVFTNQGE